MGQGKSGVGSEEGGVVGNTLAPAASHVAGEALQFVNRVYAGEVHSLTLGLGKTVDNETFGLEPENLVIVAGETKGGKTLTAVNTVYHNLAAGRRALVITTEVGSVSYLLRLIARHTKIPLSKIRDQSLPEEGQRRVKDALSISQSWPLYIAERPLCTYDEIQRAAYETEPELIVVDHLQRLATTGDHYPLALKNIVLKVKTLAVALRLPILLLSQVTFGDGWCEQDSDGKLIYKTERISTRWSREPVMEADKVLILHNMGLHRPDRRGDANLIVHSMRDYPSGEVLPLKIRPEHQWLGDYGAYRSAYGAATGVPA